MGKFRYIIREIKELDDRGFSSMATPALKVNKNVKISL
jgi:hypothetical protein